MPLLRLAPPRLATALQCTTVPLQSMQNTAFAPPCCAPPCLCIARLRATYPSLRLLGYAIPLLLIDEICSAFALPLSAVQSTAFAIRCLPCIAFAALSIAAQRHSRTLPGAAVPPHGITRTRSAIASPCFTQLLHATAVRWNALPCPRISCRSHAMPLLFIAKPSFAFAVM